MRTSYVIGSLALAASNALAAPQGVTASIAPPSTAPAGCSPSYSGKFQITVQNVSTGAKVKRDALECTLSNGVLKDAQSRTGYIADNFQFQFDGPPQAGALYTAGFSLCGNGSLALGGSAIWYQCLSGGFYNLYDRSWAPQCSPIYIQAIGYSSNAAATQATDGQVAGTAVGTSVNQSPDGQPIATTAVSQIPDGQVNSPPPPPVGQIPDGQVQASPTHSSNATSVPVSQISDGQIQAHAKPTGTPITQLPDGQIQLVSPNKTASNVTATYTPMQVSVNAAPVHTASGLAVAGLFAVVAALL